MSSMMLPVPMLPRQLVRVAGSPEAPGLVLTRRAGFITLPSRRARFVRELAPDAASGVVEATVGLACVAMAFASTVPL